MADGDDAILPPKAIDWMVNIAHSQKVNELNQRRSALISRRLIELIRQLGGSFLPRYALISQQAFVSRVVH
jgi:hypothetical protein